MREKKSELNMGRVKRKGKGEVVAGYGVVG
jgi:hypothetical protein